MGTLFSLAERLGRDGRKCAPATKLAGELVEPFDDKLIGKNIASYGSGDLFRIDELRHTELERCGAELPFQALTEREEKNSAATLSNEAFGKARMYPRTCARQRETSWVRGRAVTAGGAVVLVFRTDDSLVDPAVLGRTEVVFGEGERLVGVGDSTDDLSPALLVRIERWELRDVQERVGTHVHDLTKVERDAVLAGPECGPTDDVLLAVVEAAKELFDLFSTAQGSDGQGRTQVPHVVLPRARWAGGLTGTA
ncbi:hypothetical protein [Halostreptopolyspora alba]|uniref:hypothetical protein n=1 Tax=Halostreptopolyspora alba TaxID=2487137 RepID=UPI0011CEA116